MPDTDASHTASRGDQPLPEDFLDDASQLLGAKLSAEQPIPARSPHGLLEACQSLARALGVKIKQGPQLPASAPLERQLDHILEPSEVRHRQIRLEGDWYKRDCGPVLGFLKAEQRPVALIPHGARKYKLVDPVRRTSRLIDHKVAATLQVTGYVFYRPLPGGPVSLGGILGFAMRGRYGELVLIGFLGFLAALLSLVVPLATELIINQIIPGAERSQLLQLGLGLLMVAITVTMFHAVSAFAMLRILGHGSHDIQTALWNRVLQLGSRFFSTYTAGDLANRLDGIESIRNALSTAVVGYLLGAIFSIVNLGLIFYYNWKLAILAIILAAISALVELTTALLELKYRRKSLNLAGRIQGRVFQLISGITKWRASAAEDRALGQWADLFIEKKKFDKISGYFRAAAATFRAAYPILTTLANFAIYFFFFHGDLNTGQFLGYNAAFGQLLTAILGATSATLGVVNCIPYFERMKPILCEPVERGTFGADPGRLGGRVEFKEIRYRYDPGLPLVLDSVSFRVEPGEFVAVVGPSGCGKSTLARLLLGFEQPVSGAVLYDGRDLANLDLKLVRRQLGVVLQHDRVQSGDILHNIIGVGQYTEADAWEAAEMAGIQEDIARLPMGMHTFIPEGGRGFSGGQLQRIVIARAFVKKPAILVMDEATSALDNASQRVVSDHLKALKVTRIVIAQRLSSIQEADKIVVLHKTKVVETGTFDELMSGETFFKKLAARQMA